MISRRSLLASSAVFATVPLIARASASRLSLTGTMEQGSLIVGRTEPGARVTFDDTPVRVSPEGIFACGVEWNRTRVARLSAQFADGTREAREITPVARAYAVQHVNGLPQNTVTPPPRSQRSCTPECGMLFQ